MKKIAFFHMNEKDFSNKVYNSLYSKLIDFTDLRETYIICHFDTLSEISTRLERLPDYQLFYLGNGNYHYLTLVLLARQKEPFTLITFDHHHDSSDFPYSKMTSCGSWIQTAIQNLEFLKKVLVIGASANKLEELTPIPSPKLQLLYEKDISTKSLDDLSKQIPTKNIYISIDRDFLSEKVVQTNWEQGTHSLEDLLWGMRKLTQHHRLVGADVCGDILWDYQTLNRIRMQKTLKQSIEVNRQIFSLFSDLL